MADIQPAIGLEPRDTVEFFRSKGVYPVSRHWTDVWQEEHARAFTVAKMMDRTLLEQVRASLDKVLAEGGTFEQWKATIRPELERAGWWGRVEGGELTGVDYTVFVGEARLRTIYGTNLRMARAAGRWKRIQALKSVQPYLRYSAIMDGRTRPLHREWHGTILPVDHPWWNTHFPPCGWNCRCTVVQLSERDLRSRGWTVSEPPREGPGRDFAKADGEIVTVPAGIDPGFAYNVGHHHLRGLVPAPDLRPPALPAPRSAELPQLPEPRPLPADDILPLDTPDEEAIQAFLDALEGQRAPDGTVIAFDAAGEPLIVDQSFFLQGPMSAVSGETKLLGRKRAGRIPFMRLLARTLQEPDEIWYGWQDGEKVRRVTRRYVARFEIEGEVREAVLVMEVHPSGWRGLSAFVADDPRYLDSIGVRGGWLAYRRSE